MPAKYFYPLVILCILGLTGSAKEQKTSKPSLDYRMILLRAMVEEMDRSMKSLKMPDFEVPYFIAYEMKETQSDSIYARYGAIYRRNPDSSRRIRVETRVGSYDFDNIGSKKSNFDFSFSQGHQASNSGPVDNDPQALQNSLWLLTDQSYKQALQAYLKLKGGKVTEVDDGKKTGSFSIEPPVIHTDAYRPYSFDTTHWEQLARSASALFEDHPQIFDSAVSINGGKETRFFVNTEGSRIVTESAMYSVAISADTRADDGMQLSTSKTIYVQDESQLPSEKELFTEVEKLIANLEALRQAPVLEPYTGPAILDGDATGVLFHEVIGHRLEGERQLDDEEGKTFKEQVGQKIIPEFLSVIDDPTVIQINGTFLNGFYRFDDEGVRAQRTPLIDHGILKTFLLSRTPIDGFPKSNGHGRSSPGEKPRARMGNTIIQSNRTVPISKLKAMLIEEVKKQNKPYGLIIKNIVGGSTHTSTWGYQAYKGVPELVYRVFPDGREELVRGVEIVGTPIAGINKIISTSDGVAIFNGYCGAESGYVPVSTAAPDVLMTEIELQRSMKKSEKPPILPSPWTGPIEKK